MRTDSGERGGKSPENHRRVQSLRNAVCDGGLGKKWYWPTSLTLEMLYNSARMFLT